MEAGQAFVVLLLLPLLWRIEGKRWQPAVVRGTSLGLALVGLGWLVQRLFFA